MSIVVARLNYLDSGQPRIIGVSDDSNYRHSDASVWGGVYWPIISGSISWSVHARHPYQDQESTLSIGVLTLINCTGIFDSWTEHETAGQWVEVQRGPADAVWNDRSDRWDRTEPGHLEAVLVAEMGSIRWRGRESMTIELQSVLRALGEPIAREVFDESTPNETLINNRAPVIFGPCFQIEPKMINPSILRLFVADNLSVVTGTQEGGNPTDGWDPVPQGLQLTGPSNRELPITCHAAGPPAASIDTSDALDGIGDFSDLPSGDPDGWDVQREPPDSDIDHGTGGLLITADAGMPGDSGWLSGDASDNFGGAVPELTGASTIHEAVSSPTNSAYVDLPYGGTNVGVIHISDLGISIPSGQRLVGVEAELDVENAGTSVLDQTNHRVLFIMPDGTIRNPRENPAGAEFGGRVFVPGTRDTFIWGGPRDLGPALDPITDEQATDPQFSIQCDFRRVSSGFARIRIHAFRIKAYFEPAYLPPRLRTTLAKLTPGDRYRLEIVTLGDSSDGLIGVFGGVSSTGEPPGVVDRFSDTRVELTNNEIFNAQFTAADEHFAIAFFRGQGSGNATIERIELENLSRALSKYSQQVPYIVELAGLDPDLHVDQDEIEAHDLATGEMSIGWYVDDETTADQLLARHSGSLGGPAYHGMDGRFHSFLLLPPDTPYDPDEHIRLEDNQIGDDIEIWHDDPPALTDIVKAARNWRPLAERETAGITTTFTEPLRQLVMSDYRVTAKANLNDPGGFT